jgi:hypothetical protein
MQRRRSRRVRTFSVLLTIVTFGLSSCAIHGLAFRQDKRVSIVAPKSLSVVTTPFTLKWTVHGFTYGPGTLHGGNNYFAVFIDREPMPPGASVHVLGDDACKRSPQCPDETWLEQHDVFLTAIPELTITSLPHLLPLNTRKGTKEGHEIDVVMMDGKDRRIGESAWYVEFFRTVSGYG